MGARHPGARRGIATLRADPDSAPVSGTRAWGGECRPDGGRLGVAVGKGKEHVWKTESAASLDPVPALKPLSFPGEEESGRLWDLGVSLLLLISPTRVTPSPPIFLLRPPPLSTARPRVAADWCDPGWSRRRGRAPPSAGKLCTFPRLPFVLSWERWEGSETHGHLAPSRSLAVPRRLLARRAAPGGEEEVPGNKSRDTPP